MAEELNKMYSHGMSPKDLADKVLADKYGSNMPSIPIDPFKLMRDYGIVYQFMGFNELEGIYLVPDDESDVAVVGINYKRRITRQRFTAAHELCHHLKDRKNSACPIGAKGEIEKFAEKFAAELLMPKQPFYLEAQKYMEKGRVSLDGALQIAEHFGVSFRSCVLRLAYTYNILEDGCNNLNKRILNYKPDKKKVSLGMDVENIELLRQAVDSYVFFFQIEENIVWYRFKNDLIYNENRMEGLALDKDEVAEIVTDLRINRQESVYCKEAYETIIQVAGHSELYDYIMTTNDKLSIYKLLDLNRKLFQFAPFPEESGKTRTDNNLVLGTKFETVDWRDVAVELIKLQKPVEKIVEDADSLTVSEYILQCLKVE